MARVRMITRTVKINAVKVMVVDTTSATVDYRLCHIVGDYDEKTIEKKVKTDVETEEGISFVKVMDIETTESVYGMTEEDFMLWAKPIDR